MLWDSTRKHPTGTFRTPNQVLLQRTEFCKNKPVSFSSSVELTFGRLNVPRMNESIHIRSVLVQCQELFVR